MSIELVTDHEARAGDRLVQQFKNKDDIVALLVSWIARVQELEQLFADLTVQRDLAQAEGVNLDVLGAIVGQTRGDRSDELYRTWIAARVLVNRSSGLTEQIIAIARKLVAPARVRLEEQYPAAFTVHVDDPIDETAGVEIAKLLVLAKAAGVGAQFHWKRSEGTFRFAPDGVATISTEFGFDHGELSAISDGRDMGWAPHAYLVDEFGNIMIDEFGNLITDE